MSFSRVIANDGGDGLGEGGLFVENNTPWSQRQSDQYLSPDASILLAFGDSLDLPGPALGNLRVYNFILGQSLGATPAIDFSLNVPDDLNSPYFLGRNLSLGAATNFAVPIPASFGATKQVVIGFGETFTVANIGTANCNIWYYYYDFPASNIVLVRKHITEVPTEIIPAAPPNYFNRIINTNFDNGSSCIFNDDTIATILMMDLGPDITIRLSAGMTAGSSFAVLPGLTITTNPYFLYTGAAPTTRPPFVALAYKQYIQGQPIG